MATQVDLNLSCTNLAKMDVLSKSDPLVVVYVGNPRNASPKQPGFTWKEVARTEKQKNNSSPVFNKAVRLDYRFEEVQPLRFLVVDIDNSTPQIEDDDIIGELQTTLGEIAGSVGQKLTKPLQKSSIGHNTTSANRGSIAVALHEVGDNAKDLFALKLRGQKLDKKDVGLFGGSSDPYFILKRQDRNTGDYVSLYKSETIMKNLNPQWNGVQLQMFKLVPPDMTRQALATGQQVDLSQVKLKIEVWDYDKNSSDDEIGVAECSVADLLARKTLTLVNSKKKTAGTLLVDNAQLIKTWSFLDYLRCGCEISLMVAIDWTGSNGEPRDPRSLHYFSPDGQPNQYEQALRAVANIVGFYDRDQQFPLFGFGGRFSNGVVSHCFNLNMNPQNPHVAGVDGILHAYRNALQQVQLYGPTYFNEIIKNASSIAAPFVNGSDQKYFVLLLLTDGAINDMQQTVDAIVQASGLPVSVIIVGIGDADFSQMEALDGDNGKLKASNGRFAMRDCVQFVQFNKFKNMPYQELARETLAELPGQVEEFFNSKGIKPMGVPQ